MRKVIKNHSAMTLKKFIEKHLFRPQSDIYIRLNANILLNGARSSTK